MRNSKKEFILFKTWDPNKCYQSLWYGKTWTGWVYYDQYQTTYKYNLILSVRVC